MLTRIVLASCHLENEYPIKDYAVVNVSFFFSLGPDDCISCSVGGGSYITQNRGSTSQNECLSMYNMN